MKLKNRILSAMMAFAMCVSFAATSVFAADGAISLVPSVTEVEAGGTFTVAFNLDSNPGVTSYKGILTYGDLTLTGATDGGTLAGSQLSTNYAKSYQMYWSDGLATVNNTSTGLMATLTFAVPANAAANTVYTITVTSDSGNTNDTDWNELDFGTATATVKVKGEEKKDVVIAAPAVQKSEEANGVYNAGFLADFTVDADAHNPVKAVKFTVNNGEKDAEKTVELGTTVEAGTVKVALNILNVATGVELTTTVAPIAE